MSYAYSDRDLSARVNSPQPNQYRSEESPPNNQRKIPDLELGSFVADQLRRRQDTLPTSLDPLDPLDNLPQTDPNESSGFLKKSKQPKKPRFINPSGSVCYWWSAVVSLAFLYNFWSASYRFAFREIDTSTVLVWLSIDLIAELIYWLDIFANHKTGYLEDGVLQRDPKKIRVHYQESNLFYLDVFCVLPFDVLYLSFGYNSIFRCNRLVKIYKFWSFVDRTERHTNYPNVFRTCTLVHNILVIFHWNASIFHMISTHKIIDIEGLYKIDHNHCKDVSCQYLHAFYWSTLAIIGDLPRPKTKGEYFYVIVELIFGLILFAWVLGHVANIVTNVSAARKEFQARLDAVKTFMRTRRVSDELQTKVIRWFDYLWSSQKSSDEERSVACLPDRLKAEIAIHVNLATLERVDIFTETEVGFLRELVLRLKPVLFSPGDYVCRKDEAGHEMYIVSRGVLEVVTGEEHEQKVVATFTAGSYFGEIAVLNVGSAGNKRTASVRSVGYSDLFCLSKQDLWDVLKDYPEAEARIRTVAEVRLSKLRANRVSDDNQVSSSQRRSRSERGAEPNLAGLSQGRNHQDGSSSTSMPNNNKNSHANNHDGRRLSQRSSRSRIQPGTATNEHWHDTDTNTYGKQLECFARLLPVEQPVRLRPYGSAISHRPTVAGGTQFRGRKCLNSRTMEPIYNSAELGQPGQQQVGPMLMLGHLPIDLSTAPARVRCYHHHGCRHADEFANESYDLCHRCHAHQDEQPPIPIPVPVSSSSASYQQQGSRGGLLNFPPASPRQSRNLHQDSGSRHLSVQPHLGQSRSFECSPLGVTTRNQPLCAANRSRSGASLSTRSTPPQTTSDDNQTLTNEQVGGDCNQSNRRDTANSVKSVDNTTNQTGELPTRMSTSRPLLCPRQAQHHHHHHHHHHQEQQQQQSQSLACPGSHSRGRSSSMVVADSNNKRGLAIDDDVGFADGEEDDCDRNESGHAHQQHHPNQPGSVQNQEGAQPNISDRFAIRRQRHRQDCRHHGSSEGRKRRSQASITVAPASDSPVLLSSSSSETLTSGHQTMPPYGLAQCSLAQQTAGTGCQTTKEQSLTDAPSGSTATNRCDEPATFGPSSSSISAETSALAQPGNGVRGQLVVNKRDQAGPTGDSPRRSSQVEFASEDGPPAVCCMIEMEPKETSSVAGVSIKVSGKTTIDSAAISGQTRRD